MKRNKILAILLVVVSIVSFSPAASVAAGENLLTNSGFDLGSTSWSNINGSFATVVTDTLNGNSGRKLKLSRSSKTGSEWVYQILSSRKYTPGATYHAKTEIYGDLTTSEGFSLIVKYYKTGSPEYRANAAPRYKSNTNGRWNTVEFDFTVPDDCNESIRIWLRLYGAGTVYVDNVELYQISGPAPYTLQNSHVFHYAETETGTLSAILHDYYDEDSTEGQAQITFSISDGSTILKTKTMSFSNRKAEFTYKIGDYLSHNRKSCTYSIQVRNTLGKDIEKKTGTLYLVPRPSRLRENGDYVINGKAFNPVFGYHVTVPTADTPDAENAYKAAKRAGLNVVMVSMGNSRWGEDGSSLRASLENTLYQLEKYDLYGIFCLYGSHSVSGGGTKLCSAAGCSGELANAKAMATNLATEERVFAWAIMDEPFGAGVKAEMEAELETAYREIRARDTMHPIYICDYTDAYFSTDIKYCDVFAPDIYTGSQTVVQEAGENAMKVAEAQKKPIYMVVSTYTSSYVPTAEAVRHNIYQALFAGAKGIGYYSFDECGESGKEKLWKTALFEGLVVIGEELPILFDAIVGKTYTEEKKASYILRKYAGGEIAILPLCKNTASLQFETGRGIIPILDNENKIQYEGGRFSASIGAYTPLLFSYTDPLQFWKDGKSAETLTAGTYTVTFVGNADIYVGLYRGNELYALYIAKAGEAVPVVTVPDGEYTLSAFAFESGSLRPMVKKVSL